MYFSLSYTVLWVVALAQLLIILFLAQKLEQVQLIWEKGGGPSRSPLPIGANAPAFSAVNMDTSVLVNSSDLRTKTRVLLFLSVDCAECTEILGGIERVSADQLPGLVIFCVGDEKTCVQRFKKMGSRVPVLMRADTDVVSIYRISAVPTAVVLNDEWQIAGFRYPSSHRDVLLYLRELRDELLHIDRDHSPAAPHV